MASSVLILPFLPAAIAGPMRQKLRDVAHGYVIGIARRSRRCRCRGRKVQLQSTAGVVSVHSYFGRN